MNPDTVVNGLGLIALPIVYYALSRISAIQKELDAHRLHVSETYTKKDELNTALDKIEKSMDKLVEKLDVLIERRHLERTEGDNNGV